MRSKEFIFEDESSIEEKVKKLMSDCSDFLSTVNPHHVLYRGDKKRIGVDTFIPNTRDVSNRKPVDMHPTFHEILNEIFQKIHGYPFRNGMSCTPSELTSQEYSGSLRPIVIVPFNGTTCCFSRLVTDLFSSVGPLNELIHTSYSDLSDTYEEQIPDMNELTSELTKIVQWGKYITGPDKFSAAINNNRGGEIMLYPMSGEILRYYAFEQDTWTNTIIPVLENHR